MTRRPGALLFTSLLLLAFGGTAAVAWADGLPLPAGGNTNTIAPPGGEIRYVLHPKGERTEVARESAGGRVLDSTVLDGTFTIPLVAYDGTPSGLSADGSTLAVIHPRKRFPQERTTFAVLDTRRLQVRDVVTLPGDFSFDAISPDGASLYLINYTSPRDPTDYEVRAYDTAARRLLNRPIVDPSESDEQMRGYPMARVVSPDGRWAYTLYDGGGGTPFIHALDTTGRTAHCVDLDGLRPARLGLRQGADGGTLTVTDSGTPARVVDTATFEVSAVGADAPEAAPADSGGADGGPDWALIATIGLVTAAAVGLTVRRRRRLAST
jgi:hypothetical protein